MAVIASRMSCSRSACVYSQRDGFRQGLDANSRLEAVGGRDVDADLQDPLELALKGEQREQPGAVGEVDEQVHIAVRSVLTASDAAEDAEVAAASPFGSRDQGAAVPPQTAT